MPIFNNCQKLTLGKKIAECSHLKFHSPKVNNGSHQADFLAKVNIRHGPFADC